MLTPCCPDLPESINYIKTELEVEAGTGVPPVLCSPPTQAAVSHGAGLGAV